MEAANTHALAAEGLVSGDIVSPTPSPKRDDDKGSTDVVVGVIVGAIIVVVLIAVGLFFIARRRRVSNDGKSELLLENIDSEIRSQVNA